MPLEASNFSQHVATRTEALRFGAADDPRAARRVDSQYWRYRPAGRHGTCHHVSPPNPGDRRDMQEDATPAWGRLVAGVPGVCNTALTASHPRDAQRSKGFDLELLQKDTRRTPACQGAVEDSGSEQVRLTQDEIRIDSVTAVQFRPT